MGPSKDRAPARASLPTNVFLDKPNPPGMKSYSGIPMTPSIWAKWMLVDTPGLESYSRPKPTASHVLEN